MAVLNKYDKWNLNVLNGVSVIDWATDTIKFALATATYTPDIVTHINFSDITNEVTGGNYTAGGNVMANPSVTETGGVTTVDGDDVQWLQSGSGFTDSRYGIIYMDSGSPATSPLVGYIDFTTDKGNVNGDLILQVNATGLFDQA